MGNTCPESQGPSSSLCGAAGLHSGGQTGHLLIPKSSDKWPVSTSRGKKL